MVPAFFRIEMSYTDDATGDALRDEWPVLWPTREAAIEFHSRRQPTDWYARPSACFALSGLTRDGFEVSYEPLTA